MTQYVKFLRGLYDNYAKLAVKDKDTLYFTTAAADSQTGRLFLGDIEITGSTSSGGVVPSEISLGELGNINLSETLGTNDVLVYDSTSEKWVNKPISDLVKIETMVGATSDAAGKAGYVPAPGAGDQTKFLRGDGTWVTVDVGEIDGMLDALEERLTTMNTTVGNLQDTVNKIQEHPTVELNTRVKALEDIINDTTTGEGEGQVTTPGLKSVVSNLKISVEDHETRITTIETALQWADIPTGE